jgi:hypothetical protein
LQLNSCACDHVGDTHLLARATDKAIGSTRTAITPNVVLPEPSLHKLLQRLVLALDRGHINGVIWAVSKKARKTPNLDHPISRAIGKVYKLGHVLDGSMPDLLAPEFAPQRTILDHSHTRLYLTHGGGS